MTTDKAGTTNSSPVVNRWVYGAFVLLAVFYLVVPNDLVSAASNLGIALIFDPFNPAVKWANRKRWQKSWLIVHLIVTLALLLCGLLIKR